MIRKNEKAKDQAFRMAPAGDELIVVPPRSGKRKTTGRTGEPDSGDRAKPKT